MKTILVIEDEAQTRMIFLKSLQFEGFQAYGAGNGAEGIHLAHQYRPDLIVCDIIMPDMDGYAVLAALRAAADTAAIPFIFLTAKVTMADLRRGMNLGADDYLTKPCTVEQFLAAIATRLQRQEDLLKLYPRSPQLSTPGQSSSAADPFATDPIFPDDAQLHAVFQFIEAHYHQAIQLDDVAQAAGYSPAYLTHLVQKQTGRTIKQWIIERRMTQACQLLRTTTQPIRIIADACGYTDASYFTRQFRQTYGLSPLRWRQQLSPELRSLDATQEPSINSGI